jgi:hypothetical protein
MPDTVKSVSDMRKPIRQAIELADRRHAELTSKISNLQRRIEMLCSGSDDAERLALESETEVARIYAKAISSGDASAEKLVLSRLEKAKTRDISAVTGDFHEFRFVLGCAALATRSGRPLRPRQYDCNAQAMPVAIH